MTEDQGKYEVSERQSIETGLSTRGGLVPQNLEQMWRLAVIMSKSGLMPKGLQTPEAVCVAVQMGLEVGLTPMQAVQNIAVINGRPAVWGDSGIALVEASGQLEDFRETIEEEDGVVKATCWAKRKNRPTPVERTFTTMDAKQAGLHGKEGPWRQYPKRMTQMRARWWVLRDLFADVLKGLKAAEEVQDIIDVTPAGPQAVDDLTAAIRGKEEAPGPEAEPKAEAKVPCPQCGLLCVSETGLKRHITISHKPPEKAPEPPPAEPPTTSIEPEDPPDDPGPAEEAPLFPTQDVSDDKVFFSEVGTYWDELDPKRIEKILEAFAVSKPADIPRLRRKSFLQTCKNQLDKQLAGNGK